jgi:hypothetical protein
MSERDHDPADHKRSSRPDKTIGEISSDQRGQPDQSGVRTVQSRRITVRPLQRIDEIENEQRPHPVVGKALPHLDDEQKSETARVTQQRPVIQDRRPIDGGRSNIN